MDTSLKEEPLNVTEERKDRRTDRVGNLSRMYSMYGVFIASTYMADIARFRGRATPSPIDMGSESPSPLNSNW
jgi:hypothetical protein